MQISDLDFVLDILKFVASESPYMQDQPRDEEYVTRHLRQFITTESIIPLVYVDKGFMLGHVSAQWYSPRIEAHESLLFVYPEYRNGFTAIRLIKAFEQEARDRNAYSVSVGASLGIADKTLEAMYEKLGYIRRGHGLTKRLVYV
ncbi:acetyltransferase [Nostoc phage NMeng1]|nr:acetyltransferase [Nostoc phage NMeng1]